MNLKLFELANTGKTIRIIIQKKPDGDHIFGVSNGKQEPLICQGLPEQIIAEFNEKIANYIDTIKQQEIDAKLNDASEVEDESEPETPESGPSKEANTPTIKNISNSVQTELDFGF